MMDYSHTGHRLQVKLSAQEMFEISQEISRGFSPDPSSLMPEPVSALPLQVAADTPKTAHKPVFSQPEPESHTFSRQQLLAISRDVGRRFAPRFDSKIPTPDAVIKFSGQELLAVSETISREFAPTTTSGRTALVLLPVDPEHVHAYWRFDDGEATLKQSAQAALTLRLYARAADEAAMPLDNANFPVYNGFETESAKTGAENWFDVAVVDFEGQQKITLPVNTGASHYFAVLGKNISDQGFSAMMRSNQIHVPRQGMRDYSFTETGNTAQGLPFSRKYASGQGKNIQ